eukprot:6200613-Pleurochrysis_carterae.AAC.2
MEMTAVGDVMSSHRGRVEVAPSDPVVARPSWLKVLIRWASSVNQAGVVVDFRNRERACVAIARDLEADEFVDTSGDLAPEALAVGFCKPVEESFVLVGVGTGKVVDPNDDEEKRAAALEGEDARDVRSGVYLQVPFSTCTRLSHVSSCRSLRTCHLLMVEVGVAEHCLREGLDDVDAFHLEVKGCDEQKEDADRRFGICREGPVNLNSGSLTVAAEYPARFGSFEGAVVVELVEEAPLGPADERVF